MKINFPKIVKDLPYKRFTILFYVVSTVLFLLSFFESTRFMQQFQGNLVLYSYLIYIGTFIFSLVAYGFLFHYIEKKKKWSFYLLEIILITSTLDLVFELGYLGYTKAVTPELFEIVAGQLNMVTLGIRKFITILFMGYSAFYIFAYWKTYKK